MKKFNKKLVFLAVAVAGVCSFVYSNKVMAFEQSNLTTEATKVVPMQTKADDGTALSPLKVINNFINQNNGVLFGENLIKDNRLSDELTKGTVIPISDILTFCFVDTQDGDGLGKATLNVWSKKDDPKKDDSKKDDPKKDDSKKNNSKSVFFNVDKAKVEFYEINEDYTKGNLVYTTSADNTRMDFKEYDSTHCNGFTVTKHQLKFGENHPYLLKFTDESNGKFLAYGLWVAQDPKKSDDVSKFAFEDVQSARESLPKLNLCSGKTKSLVSDRAEFSFSRDSGKMFMDFGVAGCKNNADSIIAKCGSRPMVFNFVDEDGTVLYSKSAQYVQDPNLNVVDSYHVKVDLTKCDMSSVVDRVDKEIGNLFVEAKSDLDKELLKKRFEMNKGFRPKGPNSVKFDLSKLAGIEVCDGSNNEVLANFNFKDNDFNLQDRLSYAMSGPTFVEVK